MPTAPEQDPGYEGVSGSPSRGLGSEMHERRRAAIMATIPQRYSAAVHLAIPTTLGCAALIGAVLLLKDLRLVELWTIPITLLGGFGLEWRVHKDVLHRRVPGLSLLYERHELAHHVTYTYDDLAMRDRRELWLILMPAYAIVIAFAMTSILAIAVAALFGRNAALLMVATSMVFFLSYEWLHMAYHLPIESWIGRRSVIRTLRELHRRHHDPRLMKRWNFNVTVPLFDYIHRTAWSPERELVRDRRRDERSKRPHHAAL
jgi:hypothetical protein